MSTNNNSQSSGAQISRDPDSYSKDEARQVIFEDTEQILANLRYILQLPLLTYEQREQAKNIMGSIFDLRRSVETEHEEPEEPKPMVHTQIYLTHRQDQRLSLLAQHLRRSKSRVHRQLLNVGLDAQGLNLSDEEGGESK